MDEFPCSTVATQRNGPFFGSTCWEQSHSAMSHRRLLGEILNQLWGQLGTLAGRLHNGKVPQFVS